MSNDLPELPSIPLGRYRHYKGGEYEVIGVVRHSESLEPMVLYRPLYNRSGCWVRPPARLHAHVRNLRPSIGLDTGVLDDLAVLGDLVADKRPEVCWAHA